MTSLKLPAPKTVSLLSLNTVAKNSVFSFLHVCHPVIDEEASTDQCSPHEGPPANPCHTDLEDSILLLVILCDLGFFFFFFK